MTDEWHVFEVLMTSSESTELFEYICKKYGVCLTKKKIR